MTTAYTKLVTALNKAASTGKVLNVSKLSADGTGSRIVDYPKSGRGNKRWVEGFPIMSNNYESYRLAMNILEKGNPGGGYNQLADKFMTQHGTVKITPSPKAAGAKSPKLFGPIITNFPTYQNTPALITIPFGLQTNR